MSIGTLTTLMLGYKTAEKLHVMDKIQASDEAVEHLDDILFIEFRMCQIISDYDADMIFNTKAHRICFYGLSYQLLFNFSFLITNIIVTKTFVI